MTTDLEFDSACDSDSVLYVSLGLSCDCKPLAVSFGFHVPQSSVLGERMTERLRFSLTCTQDLATYEAADYEVCKAPAHGYASCSSTEFVIPFSLPSTAS